MTIFLWECTIVVATLAAAGIGLLMHDSWQYCFDLRMF